MILIYWWYTWSKDLRLLHIIRAEILILSCLLHTQVVIAPCMYLPDTLWQHLISHVDLVLRIDLTWAL